VTAKRRLLNTANRALRPAGVRLERLPVDGRADGFDAAERSRRAAQHAHERLITARHNSQTPEMMIADGVTDEDPANVVCMNRFISGEPGAGLEQGTTQWNHDEFGYSRLVNVLPRDLALLVRFHSVMPWDLEPYLAPSDRAFAERYHRPFFGHDQESKSAVRRPSVCLEDFRGLVGRRLPSRLEI